MSLRVVRRKRPTAYNEVTRCHTVVVVKLTTGFRFYGIVKASSNEHGGGPTATDHHAYRVRWFPVGPQCERVRRRVLAVTAYNAKRTTTTRTTPLRSLNMG